MFADPKVHKDLHVTHGDDSECWVEFYKHPVFNQMRSDAENRAVYDDVDYITIQFPGDKTKKVVRPVKDDDKQRFPKHWDVYLKTGIVSHDGTPLDEWPLLTRSEAMEMKSMGIFTVEQLSNIGDHLLSWFGAREYREKAKQWLDKATGFNGRIATLEESNKQITAQHADALQRNSELSAKLEQQNADFLRRNEELGLKFEELAKANAALMEMKTAAVVEIPPAVKRRPGRPKKVTPEKVPDPI